MSRSFFNPYTHGFFRCATASPVVTLAAPMANLLTQLDIIKKCHAENVGVVVFPELSLTGYSLQDLFQQQCLLDESKKALIAMTEASAGLNPVIITGLPLQTDGKLFNCAAVIHNGRLLGVVPKTWLPNHREFYEKRQFSSGLELRNTEIQIGNIVAPAGTSLIFKCKEFPHAAIAVEICEDLWAPVPPSTFAAFAGATLICNLSASNIVIGKADYRRLLVKSTSGRNLCGYLYTSAGQGESTTDLAWDGHAIIAENGTILAETDRFSATGSICIRDLDLEKLILERMRLNTFGDCANLFASQISAFRTVEFSLSVTDSNTPLMREIPQFPYVPQNIGEREERCNEALNIQVQGLSSRLTSSGLSRLVLGISGGLDSTLALIVACKAMEKNKMSRKNIIACTMPGFATSSETRTNAIELMKALKVDDREIDIRPSCTQMLKDLNHPFASGQKCYDVTFENVQAGERTSHLFRLANMCGGMVVGTGDLSELALGWCTYGVGDHMSHYNVNASIPKTLVRYLIASVADTEEFGEKASAVLKKILSTEISPELVPGDAVNGPSQVTEHFTGPYELQDFNLYYLTRFGFKPSKVAYLSWCTWCNSQTKYTFTDIKHWLEVFIKKFYGQSQFKRSCVPDSPKVGSGGALSPRGDWRAPSDVAATLWLNELKQNTPEE
ncbi:MAG: NAD(+) synthase [Erysipelotrichia bacterium]|nr:NAD(+) synthase [Erysipelotrichia bacterium]